MLTSIAQESEEVQDGDEAPEDGRVMVFAWTSLVGESLAPANLSWTVIVSEGKGNYLAFSSSRVSELRKESGPSPNAFAPHSVRPSPGFGQAALAGEPNTLPGK